jgi:hypothetical protein
MASGNAFLVELAAGLVHDDARGWLLPEPVAASFERLLAEAPPELLLGAVPELALFATWLHKQGSADAARRLFQALEPSLPRLKPLAQSGEVLAGLDAMRRKAEATVGRERTTVEEPVARDQRTSPLDAFLASRIKS